MAFDLTAVIRLRDQFSKNMDKARKSTEKFNKTTDRLKKIGKITTGAVAAGYAAMSAAAWKSAQTAEESTRIMAISTGAAGEALDDLLDSYRTVGRTVPDDLTKVSDAMATLNTMTGAAGSELESLTKGVLDASRMLGEDGAGNAAAFGRAMAQWQIPADKGTETLDKLFKATQDYGLGLGDISGHLTGYGAILKNAGFEMDEAAHFFSILSKEGLSVSRIMPAVNSAFRNWASEGKDSRKEFDKVIRTIRETEDSQKALALATDVFGAQGAQRLMTAIRNGVIPSVDELGSVFDNTSGLVAETNEQTMTMGERMNRLRNRMSLALEPVGRGMLDLADKAIPYLEKGFGAVVNGMDWLREKGLSAFYSIRDAIITAFPELSEFSISLSDVGDFLRGMFERAQPYIEWFISDGIPQAVSVVRDLYDRAIELYQYIADNWTKIEPWIYGIVGAFTAYKVISGIVATVIGIKTAAMTAFGVAVALATNPIFLIAAAIGVLIAIGILLYKNWDVISEKAGELWGKVTEKFNNIRDSISDAMKSVSDIMTSTWDKITGTVEDRINGIIRLVNGMIDKLNGVSISVPSWVPGIGGESFGFEMPTLPEVSIGKSHYHGLDRVPYDGYTARLHKDERVLTAQEAKQQDRGASGMSGGITVNVQTLNVRKESDLDYIIEGLYRKAKLEWEGGV